jgi:hypothetical protein
MTKLAHLPPPPIEVSRADAMKFRAFGKTAAGFRAHAASPMTVEGLAVLAGVSEDVMRDTLLALADAIDQLEADGMTPEKCRWVLGLDAIPGLRNARELLRGVRGEIVP